MEKIIIASFYKYVPIENPNSFREQHFSFCQSIRIRGRILVAEEGINGSVSGSRNQIDIYEETIKSDSRFRDIIFKEDRGLMHPFKKIVVKVKKEIVRFGQKVDLKNTGKYLAPKEFLELYKQKEEVLILDVRNVYESRIGKFSGAYTSNINTFMEFPKTAEELISHKDKKIVMYCTGGIRCEKASAYLVEKGFKNVFQLKGGILAFGKEFPDSVWEGKCFVFDKRLLSSINNEDNPIVKCDICKVPCDLYKNCAYKTCDAYCILCLDCERTYGGCCSKNCFMDNCIA